MSSILSHYKRKMERHLKDSDVLLHCLSKLDKVLVSIALLQETGIGRTVNSLKKKEQGVGEAARNLVAKWKEVVAAEDSEEELSGPETINRPKSPSTTTRNEREEEEEEGEKERKRRVEKSKKNKDKRPKKKEENIKSVRSHRKKDDERHSSNSTTLKSSSSSRGETESSGPSSFEDALGQASLVSLSRKKVAKVRELELPVISPNYKPLPERKYPIEPTKRGIPSNGKDDDEALSCLISKNKHSRRTAVYSGVKKTGYMGPVPSLLSMCINVLQENVDDIYECGNLDYNTLKPVLERANPSTLMQIEEHNVHLMIDTGELWERICKKNFPKEPREEFESWREMFERCTNERALKLERLKGQVKESYKREESSFRQVKLAYVDGAAKPPRGVARAQLKNGTASGVKRSTPSSSRDHSTVPGSSSSSSTKKPKMAPLMSKTLKMARGIKGGFRR